MRRLGVVLLVVVQLLVLAYMAGAREYIRGYGTPVWLRTAPIDPRDPFRGDFVRLHYGFNRVPVDAATEFAKGQVVYAALQSADRELYQFAGLSPAPPADHVFLQGRVERGNVGQADLLTVRYGIEQLFVQQGQGKQIELRRGAAGEIQVPMEVRVAVGADGTSVVTDYRWSSLGMQLAVIRFNRLGRDGEIEDADLPLSPKLRLTLQNVASQPLAVQTSPVLCRFTLVAADDPMYVPLVAACADGVDTPQAVEWLAPDAQVAVEIDLAQPQWFVQDGGQWVELGTLARPGERYRIVYRSPDAGQFVSQAFTVSGRVD